LAPFPRLGSRLTCWIGAPARQGRTSTARNPIRSDKAATETYERFAAHPAANAVDLGVEKATLGVFLKMDPKTERFVGNEKANELLTREYRAPFVVPDKVQRTWRRGVSPHQQDASMGADGRLGQHLP